MAAAMAVILRKQRPLQGPARLRPLGALPDLDAGRGLPGEGQRAGDRSGRRHRPGGRLHGVGGLVLRHHDRDAVRREHRPPGADAEDRPPAGLDVRGHDRLRRAGRAGPDAGVPVADGAGAPEAAGVHELRPHAGPPVAGLLERLPGLRAATPDSAVPLLERLGQQPRPLPARSSSWGGSAATAGGARRSAR